MVIGHLSIVICHWLKVICHWLLVIGHLLRRLQRNFLVPELTSNNQLSKLVGEGINFGDKGESQMTNDQ
ncbi:D-galactonate transporter [Scytonema sp. UIC 10036]|nr:D-galactonate transporter [Scytonema sp. UIC 10036]